ASSGPHPPFEGSHAVAKAARLIPGPTPGGMSWANSLAFVAGLAAGVAVTRRLHDDPEAGLWGERIGATRMRFANLPVGGTLAITASLVLPPRVAGTVRALGAGALVGAVGWAIVDPLPPLP
ncbi:MAG: hypothetical protein ACR2FZ_09130, partial [Thermoleophilaceae bacterium]